MGDSSFRRPQKIALVDWEWAGHHPTYFNNLVLACEELGLEVLALCPQPDEAAATATKTRKKPASEIRHPTRFVKIQRPAARFGSVRPRWIPAGLWALRNFLGIERAIRKWNRSSGRKVDVIFYPYIDVWEFHLIHSLERFLRMPWVGIYMQAYPYRMPHKIHPHLDAVPRPDLFFGGRLCRGVGIMDEGIVEQVAASTGKPVVFFPDPPDTRLPSSDEDKALGDQLKKFAAGRPIVGLFGYLVDSKGVATFLEAARLIPESEICFALAGFVADGPGSRVKSAISSARAECKNLWHHEGHIANEPALNHLFSASDVIVAAYWDFHHSSGIIAKAAVFKKPAIVSDGFLMAERARQYRTGEVVPQKDPVALRDAILKIVRDPAAWHAERQPRWQDFSDVNSYDRLKASLNELMMTVLSRRHQGSFLQFTKEWCRQ